MLFFRTISLVAALAFATLSSAAPVEGGLVSSGEVFARDASELSLPLKRGGGNINDLYDTCHSNVETIIVEINVDLEARNYDNVYAGLQKIVVEINVLIEGVQGLDVDVNIDVEVFASVVFGLIQTILAVLKVVININVQITGCISQIGNLLGSLINVSVVVVVGLKVSLSPLLQSVGSILGSLGLVNIFVGIGIEL